MRYDSPRREKSSSPDPLEQSDKDISCHIAEKGPLLVNVETDTADLAGLLTPRTNNQDAKFQEIDFCLTSSKEIDHKYRSIFSQEKEDLEAIHEDDVLPPVERSDKSIQMLNQPEERISDVHSYVKNMDQALCKREKQEKIKLRNKLKNRRISDKSYKHEKQVLEKWVEGERTQIKKTKNILLQGWMKANEIIGHLEKDKMDLFRKLEEKRGRLSPTSQSSNFSVISFCRSDNSFGTLNASALSNARNQLNFTTEYDVCNNLRRRSKPKHKRCNFRMKESLLTKNKDVSVDIFLSFKSFS